MSLQSIIDIVDDIQAISACLFRLRHNRFTMSTNKKPSFSSITVPAHRPRVASRHNNIKQVYCDVFMVRGKMLSTPSRSLFERLFLYYSRTMTIVRSQHSNGDYELTLINTIRLNEKELVRLAELGQIKHVVRLGAFHGVDDAFYVQGYNAKYWVVKGMTNALGLDVEPEILASENLPIPGAKLFSFDHLNYPEAIVVLSPTEERSGVAITVDAIQNHTSIFDLDNSPLVSLVIWRIGLTGPARLGPIWMRNQIPGSNDNSDKPAQHNKGQLAEFFRPQFERLLSNYDFDMLMPGHGWPIHTGAKQAIKASMDRQL